MELLADTEVSITDSIKGLKTTNILPIEQKTRFSGFIQI
jgi:hypothetical protein